MNRVEIEAKLNRDRAWLLETYAMMSADDLVQGVTPSEHDSSSMWTPKDHLVHLAGIEFNFVRMVRRHLGGETNPVAPHRRERSAAHDGAGHGVSARDDGVVDGRAS